MTLTGIAVRMGISASLAAGGVSHAYLYLHGYRHIPTIGTAFVLQASVSLAVATLILVGGPTWFQWVAAVVASGTLGAFALSRTVGLLGFTERGWEPSPYAAISVIAELLTGALWAGYLASRRRVATR